MNIPATSRIFIAFIFLIILFNVGQINEWFFKNQIKKQTCSATKSARSYNFILAGRLGVVWEIQEIFKTNFSKDAADNLVKQKISEIFAGKTDYYKVVETVSVNFLVV